jgi:hypothetical protein
LSFEVQALAGAAHDGSTGRGVPPDTVDKLRKMLAFLDDMEDAEELRMLPSW